MMENYDGFWQNDPAEAGALWARMRWLMLHMPDMRFRLERARSAAVRTNVHLSFTRGSGEPADRTERAVEILEDARAAYARLNSELSALRTQAAPLIRTIPDPTLRRAMEMRYLQGKSVRAIAWDMAYSERHIFRLLKAAEIAVQAACQNETTHVSA